MRHNALFYCSFFILTFIGLVGFQDSVLAVDPPILLDIKIQPTVELDQASGIYTYYYTFSNPSINTGQIWSIQVEMLKSETGADVGREGVEHEPGGANIIEPVVTKELAKEGKILVPVGLYSPKNWGGGPSVRGKVGWGANNDPYFIKPGQTLSGFRMISRGLPGIRDITIYPRMPFELWAREDDPPEEQARKDALEEEVAFKGKTIGPTAPPANFVALDFLTYLIDLKHKAAELGWITNKGVENSLDVKLDQVKAKLQAGDTKTASNLLNAFLNELDAQGCQNHDNCPEGKHLAPEAWGLLYLNGKYLLEHL